MKIEISDALSLEVQKHGERYYIEWGCIGSDDAQLNRWVSFVRRRCPRKDRSGRYFETRIDANRVIREFATKEKERAEREANRRRRAAGPVTGGLLQGVGQAASQQKGGGSGQRPRPRAR